VETGALTMANNAGLTKLGGGIVNINGPQSNGTGTSLTVSAGTANVNTNAGSAAARNLSVNANSTTNFGSTQHLNNLSVGAGTTATLTPGGSKVLVSNVPTIAGATGAWTGTIDLTDNDEITQSSAATKTADFARMYDQLKSGFAGGVWTGTGITSSTAATSVAADTGLSLVDNALLGATNFSGQTVNNDSLLLKYTYYGDIDLNGQVDGDDLTVFALNFGRTTGATQVDGDIDFNGRVDGEDLTVFANNFGKGIGNPLAAGAVAAVPEPASLVLAGLGAAGVLAGVAVRRRKNSCR
jgi:PEP-CTERM motif